MEKEDIFDEIGEEEGLEKACKGAAKALGVNEKSPIIIIYMTKSGHVRIAGTTDYDPIIASFLDWMYQFKKELFDRFVLRKIEDLTEEIKDFLPGSTTKH